MMVGRSKAKHLMPGVDISTLDNWTKFRKEAGIRGKKNQSATEGALYGWTYTEKGAGYDWKLEHGPNASCSVCGGDLLTGMTGVRLRGHPDWGYRHTQCLTWDEWTQFAPPPWSGGQQWKVKKLHTNDATFQKLVDDGTFKLFTSVPAAVDAMRKNKGMAPIDRKEETDEGTVGSEAEVVTPAAEVSPEDPWMGRFSKQTRPGEDA